MRYREQIQISIDDNSVNRLSYFRDLVNETIADSRLNPMDNMAGNLLALGVLQVQLRQIDNDISFMAGLVDPMNLMVRNICLFLSLDSCICM